MVGKVNGAQSDESTHECDGEPEPEVARPVEQQSDGSEDDESKSSASSKKSSEDEDFEVERIIDFKIEGKIKYFLIRWKGYDSSADTWEKEKCLDCPELIAKFHEKHPEAHISSTTRKRKNSAAYAVSDSDIDPSDEESSESDSSEPALKVKKPQKRKSNKKRGVGRPKKNPDTKVARDSKKVSRVIGRPRKYDLSGDDDNYEVEDIIDFGVEDGIKYFLIRWKGYDSSADSWEEHRSLNCVDLILKFYKKHPEARATATKQKFKKRYSDSDYSDSDVSKDSNFGPSYYEQYVIKHSSPLKKTGNKSKDKRKSGRQTKVRSTYKYRVNNTSEDESESEFEEAEPVIKKAVGRKKNLSSERRPIGRPRKQANVADSEDDDQGEPPVKRSIGRPRKQANEADNDQAEPPVKKSIGRPRKQANVADSKDDDQGEPTVKKSKGRPRKQANVADSEDDDRGEPTVKKSKGRPRKQEKTSKEAEEEIIGN